MATCTVELDNTQIFLAEILENTQFLNNITELSHVVQVRAEGPKAPSPGHRPGYDGNQQDAL